MASRGKSVSVHAALHASVHLPPRPSWYLPLPYHAIPRCSEHADAYYSGRLGSSRKLVSLNLLAKAAPRESRRSAAMDDGGGE
jgi:hypothetical protein